MSNDDTQTGQPTVGRAGRIPAAIELIRPGHWVKNVLVFFPVVFATRELARGHFESRMGETQLWVTAAIAAAAFCLASSAAYIVNDIRDRQKDRLHPKKKNRPLAAGRISPRAAGVEAAVLAAGGLTVALSVNRLLAVTVAAYLALQMVYTFYLKSKMLVDVICIAVGFVLRAVAGAVAIAVVISPWLFVCTFTICLFLGFCKRCNEVVTLPEAVAHEHRATLSGYTPELLTHLITLSAAIAVVGFVEYALSQRTVEHFGTNFLIYTVPLVVYGVFRFAMLSMNGVYADPTELILRDWPFQLTAVAWTASAVVVIRWGKALQDWLGSF